MLGGSSWDPAALEFRLLGPVEVWRDGRQLRLGGERQRGLLALLLLHANELVGTDKLVEQLFGIDAGVDGLRSLRVAVSRLRRVLSNGDESGVLLTRPGGYCVEIEPGQLDVAVFTQLLEAGQRASAVGDPSATAAKLREALALWRGPALADLTPLEFVAPEIRRLEELRLTALAERIEADLARGLAGELIAELEAMVAANPLQERVRGQLMLALYRAGRQADALAVYRQTSELLRDQLGIDPSRALQRLELAMLQQDPALELAIGPPTPPRDRVAVCPFKGLAAYERSDAEYFCGRERLVSELVAHLAAAPFVGIVGPSGVGKSSVLRAGLLPALAAGALPGSAGWRQVIVRPGAHPCDALAQGLGTDDVDRSIAALGDGNRVVLAVDQLEELFTVCRDDRQRAAFVSQLEIAASHHGRALVLVSLRADFYGRCAAFPRFAQLLSRNNLLVGPMDRDELRRAIEVPSARAGLELEGALLDALVTDVAGEAGGLPLLSTALLKLWQTREGTVLSYRRYRSSGGVGGGVARLAEDAYTRLPEADQLIVRSLMLRLASGEEGSLARRRLELRDLEALDHGARVTSLLADARLLTIRDGEVEVSHEALLREWPRFRAWIDEDRAGRRVHAHLTASAREWEARGRDPGELYRGARLAAIAEWTAQHPDELTVLEHEFVAAGSAQTERNQQRQRTQNRRLRGLLTGVGVLLVLAIGAGIVALVKQHMAARAARVALGRQLGAEAVSEPRIDVAMLLAREAVNLDREPQTEGTLLTTLLRSPAALATFTLPLGARPQGVALSPDGRTLAVPDNQGHLRLYDARTHVLAHAPLSDLFDVDAPVYSGDGKLLLYTAKTGTGAPVVAVRDAHTLQMLRTLQFDRRAQSLPADDNPWSNYLIDSHARVAYYGYWLLTPSGGAGAAYLDRWSLRTGRLLGTTSLGAGPLLALRLLAATRRLVVLKPGASTVYDTRSLRPVDAQRITPALNPMASAGISPNGRTAVIGSPSGSVAFADLSTGAVRQGTSGHSAFVAGAIFSPDGRVAVTTGNDHEVIVWDPATATPLETLSGHAGAVHGAAFSADGRTLYTSSLDGVVLEWDLGGSRRFGRPFSVGTGLPNPPPDTPGTPPLAVSPDGSRFAVRLGAGGVGLFSARTLQRQGTFTIAAQAGTVTDLAFSPDGSELAVAGHSGFVQMWRVQGSTHPIRSFAGLRPRYGLPEAVQAIAFDRRGGLLAASDIQHTPGTTLPDGRLAIWHTGTGTLLGKPTDLGEPGDSLAISPDGSKMAVGLDNGSVEILDPSNGRRLRQLLPVGSADHQPIVSLAIAPNGTLATGSWAGLVQLWHAGDGYTPSRPLLVAAGPVASIAFDPSGRRFATVGSDGSAALWFTTLKRQGAALQGDPGQWGNAAFSPNGSTVSVIYDDGRGLQLPATPAAWEQHACLVAGRNFTHQEWAQFVTGDPYARVCE